jgi:AAA domain/Bifunctional DNA primase/polymerase, N-terminal
MSALKVALAYMERGWSPVPVPEGAKGPRIPGWQKLRITQADAAQYFNGAGNVGVLLGKASGGLGDVDLDCPEALDLAPRILPATGAVFGRASKPRSHYLYRIEGPVVSLQLRDPLIRDRKRGMLVEVRGDKVQTIFPESTHPSGELIEWEEDGETAVVDYATLTKFAKVLAAGCLIRRYLSAVKNQESLPAALREADPRLARCLRNWLNIEVPHDTFPSMPAGQQRAPRGAESSLALRGLANLNQCPPCNEYEKAKLRSALWFRDAAGHRPLDPCDPTFTAWENVLYPLAWLGINGWPWDWLEDLFVEYSAEGGEQGDYRGRDWCVKRLRGARDDTDNPKTIRTIYKLARDAGWVEPRYSGAAEAASESIFGEQAQAPPIEDIFGERQAPSLPSGFRYESDDVAPLPMLIKKLLPASGVAFIGGQSRAGKTFIAVAMGVALASGKNFFNYRVKERVGVLYVAGEGGANFGARITAAKRAAGVEGPIPFVWVNGAPPLKNAHDIGKFVDQLQAVAKDMRERFGVRLGVVVLDTVAACFTMKDENANAEVSEVCGRMRAIAERSGAVVIPVHHYGKDAGTGLRGASAWQGAADVVISVEADITGSGEVSGRGLAVAKARDAEMGPVAAFRLENMKLGVDEDGDEFGSMVVRPELGREWRKTGDKTLKSIADFEAAFQKAITAFGETVKEGSTFRKVDLKHVRAAFEASRVTGESDPQKAAKAAAKAWERLIKNLPGYVTWAAGEGAERREWIRRKPSHGDADDQWRQHVSP